MPLSAFQLKALGQILGEDLSGLTLGSNEIDRDGVLWHEPISSHPWKNRVYESQPTEIRVSPAQVVAMNLLAEKLAKAAKAEADEKARLEEVNKALHKSMRGKSWTHVVRDEDGDFEIEITVDGLGWTCGGCFGTFPKTAITEAEAINTITAEAEGEILHATDCE